MRHFHGDSRPRYCILNHRQLANNGVIDRGLNLNPNYEMPKITSPLTGSTQEISIFTNRFKLGTFTIVWCVLKIF